MAHTAQDPASGRLTASSTTAQMQTPEMMDESRKGTGSTAISMQAKAQSWEGTCSDDSVGLIGKESLPTLKQSTQKTSILHWLQLQLKLWGKKNKQKQKQDPKKQSFCDTTVIFLLLYKRYFRIQIYWILAGRTWRNKP